MIEFMKALKELPMVPPNAAKSKGFERSPKAVSNLRHRVTSELLEYKDRLEREPMVVKKELETQGRWRYYVPLLSTFKAERVNQHTAPGGRSVSTWSAAHAC